MKVLFFDTETTGCPSYRSREMPDPTNLSNYDKARLVEIAWQMYDNDDLVAESNYIVKPKGFEIPKESSDIHGITHQTAVDQGIDAPIVLQAFHEIVKKADLVVAYNIKFDNAIVLTEGYRHGMTEFCEFFQRQRKACAMEVMMNHLQTNKWISLGETHNLLFQEKFNAHHAIDDVKAMVRCFNEVDDWYVNFGKYAKKSVRHLLADRSYCQWFISVDKFKRHPYHYLAALAAGGFDCTGVSLRPCHLYTKSVSI